MKQHGFTVKTRSVEETDRVRRLVEQAKRALGERRNVGAVIRMAEALLADKGPPCPFCGAPLKNTTETQLCRECDSVVMLCPDCGGGLGGLWPEEGHFTWYCVDPSCSHESTEGRPAAEIREELLQKANL
jgi:hypothetical protein